MGRRNLGKNYDYHLLTTDVIIPSLICSSSKKIIFNKHSGECFKNTTKFPVPLSLLK